jgi:hypothetical protein
VPFSFVQNANALTVEYVYEDQDGAVIDLTPYAAVSLLAIPPDGTGEEGKGPPAEIPATFDADKTTGRVYVDYTSITTPGLWQFQFRCEAPPARPLYGLAVKVNVEKNLDD